MRARYFSEKLAEWYLQHRRELPWRATKDPYKIWISEIILQQTRVSQGLPYYLKFINAFPTVNHLASAPEQKVLRLWQGLGYYTRARNLHKCAKEIVKDHKGIFPTSFDELKKLPGIGDYTAAAVASIAFKEPVAVVDGNVFRVLSRIFGIDKAINSPEGRKHFTTLANELIDVKDPDIHNQAVMEFGALHCVPKNPQCSSCIFQSTCFAYKNDMQDVLPVKISGKVSRKRYFHYFVVQKGKSLLMRKRDEKDIWQGLYDFYLVEKTKQVSIGKLIAQDEFLQKMNVELSSLKTSASYKHILSHQVIQATFTVLKTSSNTGLSAQKLKFFTLKKVADLPKPVLISRFLNDEQLL